MPVELNITESVTSLDTTVVQVTLESASEPGPAGPGVPTGGTDGQVLTKTSGTDYATAWEDPTGGGGGGVTDADYLVGTAHGDLSAEIVVGTTPGGELGGTWASPTVDATHSGSSHAAVQAAAEATAAAALSAHDADTTGIHGIADTSALALTASHPTNATFNDHSARHEDGGADEISLTGLSGIPAALTTHEADTTNVHGITDTSALALTSGVPSNATFNDHSARHENGGADEISIAGLDGTPTELTNHLSDATAAHAASAVSADSTTLVGTGTDVQAVLEELDNGIADHIADATAAHAATAIAFTPAGTIAATTVQAAIEEVASEAGGGGGSGTKAYAIQLLNPRTTSLAGNSFFTVLGLTDWDAGHWEFVLDVEGKIYGIVRVPPSYASGGAIKLEIGANATSGVTRLQVGTKAVADGESMNPTLTDETAQDITVPGTAYLRKAVSFTLTETLAASDLLLVEIFHDGDHANDTLAVNTLLFGAWLEVTA